MSKELVKKVRGMESILKKNPKLTHLYVNDNGDYLTVKRPGYSQVARSKIMDQVAKLPDEKEEVVVAADEAANTRIAELSQQLNDVSIALAKAETTAKDFEAMALESDEKVKALEATVEAQKAEIAELTNNELPDMNNADLPKE